MDTKDWLSPRAVAFELDVTSETVRAWCRDGKLPHRRVGGSIRIDRLALERFLNNQHQEGGSSCTENVTGTPSLSV